MLCTPAQLLQHLCPCLASRSRSPRDPASVDADEQTALLSANGDHTGLPAGPRDPRAANGNATTTNGYGSTSALQAGEAVNAKGGAAASSADGAHHRVKRIDVGKSDIDKRRDHVLSNLHHLDASTLRTSSTPPATGRGRRRKGTTSSSDASSPTDMRRSQAGAGAGAGTRTGTGTGGHARASSSSASISSTSSPPSTSAAGQAAPPTSALGRRTRRVHTSVSGKVRALHLGLRPESPPGPSFAPEAALGNRELAHLAEGKEIGDAAAAAAGAREKAADGDNESARAREKERQRGRPVGGRRTSSLDQSEASLKRRMVSEHSLRTIHGSGASEEDHEASCAAPATSNAVNARSPRLRLKEAQDASGPMVEDWEDAPVVKNLITSDLELESGTESEREPVGVDARLAKRR